MANIDYSIKFTDEVYATKDDVANALQTTLIDDTWDKTLSYRLPHRILLPLRNLGKAPFRVTLNKAMLGRINECDLKLQEVKKAFLSYDGDQFNTNRLIKTEYSNVIRIMCQKYGIEYDEELLDDIYSKNYEALSKEELLIAHYIDALREMEEHFADPINEDLITRLYSILSASLDAFILYRQVEYQQPANTFYAKEYQTAPVNLIETMMENLFDFVNNSAQSVIVKFAAVYYSIKLIKPFEKYHDELAMLLAKMVLAHGDRYNRLDNIAMYLPLEEILVNYNKRYDKVLGSIQKENDITYIVFDFLEYFKNASNYIIDSIVNFGNKVMKEEVRRDDEVLKEEKKEIEEEKVSEQKEIEVEQISIFDHDNQTVEETKEEKPVAVETKKEEPVVIETKKEEIPTLREEVSKEKETKIAKPIDKIQPVMNEREATKYEKYLLESDPRLKKGQAHFYARHCTVGMYYTIKQYKRMVGCVYETARTSMEDLVTFGYYKKEQIKNKFVYTPVVK